MRIVFEPREFEVMYNNYDINSVIQEIGICPEFDPNQGPIVLYCPTKIIYYPELYNDVNFFLPVFISNLVSIRRILKYHSNHHTFYIRNTESNKWHQTYFYDYEPFLNKKQQATLQKGIKRAQEYPEDKLGYNDESPEDELYRGLCRDHLVYGINIFAQYPPPIMVTGRYEIYYTRYGLESKHRFIDIIVDDTLIK